MRDNRKNSSICRSAGENNRIGELYRILGVSFLPVLIMLFTTSLSFGGIGGTISSHNDEIDAQIRNEIHALNKKIISSYSQNNPQLEYDLSTPEFKKQGLASVKEFYEKNRKIISETQFDFTNDYYVMFKGLGEMVYPVLSETKPQFFSSIKVSNSGPRFISFMESKGNFQDLSLVFVYEKVEKTWRLFALRIGTIRIANKTPVAWFEEANDMYNKGHYLPAMLRLSIAEEILRPADFVQYEKEHDIKRLISECKSKMKKYNIPISLDLKTNPRIFNVDSQFLKQELLPVIKYISSIPLEKEDDIRNEAHSMMPLVMKLFPGISAYSDYVVFKAYEELPVDPQKKYRGFGVTVETGNRK